MVRQKTIEKVACIKKCLKLEMTIRQIKTECKCGEDLIRRVQRGEFNVPIVPKKIRTVNPNPTTKNILLSDLKDVVPNKKRTIKDKIRTLTKKELNMVVKKKNIHLAFLKQYGAFKKDKNNNETIDWKYPIRMKELQDIEENETEYYGVIFDYVFQRKADQELKIFHKEINFLNGGH